MDDSPTIQHLHGRIRSITVTDPAADNEILETVPARRRWRLISIRFKLITDANVANRIVTLTIDDGTNNLLTIPSDTAQTASLTRYYHYHLQPVPQFLIDAIFSLPLPDLFLAAGFRIQTLTTGLQAGDDFSVIQLLVEEWIDP